MKRISLAVLFLTTAFFLTGCFGVDGNFKHLRNKVFSSVKGKFSKEVEFSIGSVGLWLGEFVVELADEEESDLAADILDQISSVQVGVYNRTKSYGNPIEYSLLKSIDIDMQKMGWKYIVRARDNNELTAVYVPRNTTDELEGMYVITVNNDEVVIVEVNGRLDRVVALAVAEKGLHFDM